MTTQPEALLTGKGTQLRNQDGMIRLGLRSVSLEDEIRESLEPYANVRHLLEMIVAERVAAIDCRYRQVCRFIELRKHGEYWKPLGFTTEAALLAQLDLRGGVWLAEREAVVRLVDRETFLLVGDDELIRLVRLLRAHQKNAERRRSDLLAIFEGYSQKHTTFDRQAFRNGYETFVRRNYVNKALARETKKQSTRPHKQNSRQEKTRVEAKENAIGCFRCEEAVRLRRLAITHVERLERFISENLGGRFVPARPREMR